MIFETHAHYDDDRFDEDRDILLGGELKAAGVDYIMNVASDMASVKTTIELTVKYADVYGALGIHPDSADELDDQASEFIRKSIRDNKKIRAVGEIGFDYYHGRDNSRLQEDCFSKQIEIALDTGLPSIIHSRDAAEDTYRVLKHYYSDISDRRNGVIHCFSYSKEEAEKYVMLGFNIGVGGVVTFSNGRKLKETVAAIPLDHIVLETDSPYLAPVPHRGERNTSANIPLIASVIAEIKGISAEEVYSATMKNAKEMYGLQKGNDD